MKKTFLLLLFALGISVWGWGQIAAWDSNGLTGGGTAPWSATTVAANVQGTPQITVGSGCSAVGGTPPANAFVRTAMTAANQAGAITGNDYFEFSISPSAGYNISYSTIDANFRRTTTGANNFIFQYSLDGFATSGIDIGTSATYANNTNGVAITQISLTGITALQNVTGTVSFRLYWWGETGSTQSAGIGRLAGDDLSIGGTVTLSGGSTPPTLTAAPGATVDDAFDVTFTDNVTWRAAITSITIGGTPLTAGSLIDEGKITFTPSTSSPANLLQTPGSKEIVVIATGYSNATVTQSIGAGAPNKLAVITQPGAPASNGAVLGTQPVVAIRDQYGNATTSTATVSAAVGAGTWSIGGTTNKDGVSGTATFTDLTATSAAAVIGATISFTSSGLTGITSNGFDIPGAPDPEPTNHATDFTATTNSHNQITLTWTDATGTQLPHAYLVKAAVAPATPTAPTDGVAEGDGTLVKNIDFGEEEAVFTGLDPGTTYNFAIWPYTNSGADIDYKTDGTVPNDDGTTLSLPKVFISEYIEGTSNNKAIEIFNGEGTNLDLNKLTVKLYANGSTSPSNTFTGSAGSFNANSAYVIANSLANAEILGIADVTNAVANYNGNDAIEVVYDGATTDILGVIGNNPGTGWAVAGTANATADKTLLRKLTVTQGTSNWTTSAGTDANNSQWIIKDADYAKNLGSFATAWLGTLDEEWTTETNWDIEVPASNTNVLINNVTNSPSISAFTEIKALHLKTGSSLTIESDGSLTVNGSLTNSGSLTIKSDASGTGSLIVNGSISGSGTATVERYLTQYQAQGDNRYHFISSPVTAQNIQPEFVNDPPSPSVDFYKFSETDYEWVNSKLLSGDWNPAFESQFEVGRGYMVAYSVNLTKNFTGALNNNASYMLTCTHTADQGKGWNLLGNPYQAAIDWDAVTLGDGMDNALYYYDSQNEKYRYYISYPGINNANYLGSGSRHIPPMQGFMVHAKSTGTKTVTIEKSDLAHQAQTTFYKSGYNLVPGSMALTLISGERRDEAFVHFTSGATEAFDGQYDAYKLLSGNAGIPEIYTTNSGNVKFAINGLPELSGQTEVPVSIKANQPGVYTISADLSNLPATAYLNDLKTGAVHNLSQNPVYTFTAAEGDAPNRFKLTFGSVGIETPAGQPIAAYYAAGRLHFVNAQAEKTIEVFNLAGQRIIFAKTTDNEYPVNLSAGMYVVKVSTAQQLVSAKFFVK